MNRPLSASVTAVASPAFPASTVSMAWDALGRQTTETDSILGQSAMQYDSAVGGLV